MSKELYLNTVTPLLNSALNKLMQEESLRQFRLVGGTSLSLQLGHRLSVDLDLFTDAPYGSIDFTTIDNFLRNSFDFVSEPKHGIIGMGQSYLVGDSEADAIKLDVYYTEPFMQPELIVATFRLATVEEIIAMKIDIVQRLARKKDFWDLHELLEQYTPAQMIALHKTKYPYNHDEELIQINFTNFTIADNDFDPVCLKGKYWEIIKYDFVQAMR